MRISDWSSDVCSSDLTAFWTCTGGYGGYGGQSCDSRLKRRPLSFVSGRKGRSKLAGIRLIILTINMFLHNIAFRDEGFCMKRPTPHTGGRKVRPEKFIVKRWGPAACGSTAKRTPDVSRL